MKHKNIILNLSVGVAALIFGIAWVSIYQLILRNSIGPNLDPAIVKIKGVADFDINDPDSVLPIDFNEDELSSPHEDDSNSDLFDPEGTYTVIETIPMEFDQFQAFTITNKRLDVDCDDQRFGEFITPNGFINWGKSDIEMSGNFVDPVRSRNIPAEFDSLHIEKTKIQFKSQEIEGIQFTFTGNFLFKGNFYTLDPDAKVVEGTLARFINGKKTAETKVSFTWNLEMECVC
ncbi:MAG: hypothetical protein R2681_14075 [Pyrinomonadaceae bacterium]